MRMVPKVFIDGILFFLYLITHCLILFDSPASLSICVFLIPSCIVIILSLIASQYMNRLNQSQNSLRIFIEITNLSQFIALSLLDKYPSIQQNNPLPLAGDQFLFTTLLGIVFCLPTKESVLYYSIELSTILIVSGDLNTFFLLRPFKTLFSLKFINCLLMACCAFLFQEKLGNNGNNVRELLGKAEYYENELIDLSQILDLRQTPVIIIDLMDGNVKFQNRAAVEFIRAHAQDSALQQLSSEFTVRSFKKKTKEYPLFWFESKIFRDKVDKYLLFNEIKNYDKFSERLRTAIKNNEIQFQFEFQRATSEPQNQIRDIYNVYISITGDEHTEHYVEIDLLDYYYQRNAYLYILKLLEPIEKTMMYINEQLTEICGNAPDPDTNNNNNNNNNNTSSNANEEKTNDNKEMILPTFKRKPFQSVLSALGALKKNIPESILSSSSIHNNNSNNTSTSIIGTNCTNTTTTTTTTKSTSAHTATPAPNFLIRSNTTNMSPMLLHDTLNLDNPGGVPQRNSNATASSTKDNNNNSSNNANVSQSPPIVIRSSNSPYDPNLFFIFKDKANYLSDCLTSLELYFNFCTEGKSSHIETINLKNFLTYFKAYMEPLAAEKGIEIVLESVPSMVVQIEYIAFRTMLFNVLLLFLETTEMPVGRDINKKKLKITTFESEKENDVTYWSLNIRLEINNDANTKICNFNDMFYYLKTQATSSIATFDFNTLDKHYFYLVLSYYICWYLFTKGISRDFFLCELPGTKSIVLIYSLNEVDADTKTTIDFPAFRARESIEKTMGLLEPINEEENEEAEENDSADSTRNEFDKAEEKYLRQHAMYSLYEPRNEYKQLPKKAIDRLNTPRTQKIVNNTNDCYKKNALFGFTFKMGKLKFCPTPHFLIVEDDVTGQKTVMIELSNIKFNFTVDSAQDGKSVIEKVKSLARQGYKFDTIFMDIDLIGMNGLRASQIIRQYEELHGFHTNIICVTGKDKSQLTDNIFDNYRKYIYIYIYVIVI